MYVLFLELSDISVPYEIKQPAYMFQGVTPTTSLLHIWFKTSLYLLKYALNLALGMVLVLYYSKYPVTSGGLRPPASEITSIQTPSQKILDPPLQQLE